jgi:hypothetical protein
MNLSAPKNSTKTWCFIKKLMLFVIKNDDYANPVTRWISSTQA